MSRFIDIDKNSSLTVCDCNSPDCNIWIEMEYDEDFNFLFLRFYKKISWRYTDVWGFFRQWHRRIKTCLCVLFNGWVELDETFIIRGEDRIKEFEEQLKKHREACYQQKERKENET